MPTVDSLRKFHTKEVRLDIITRNILASNLELCPDQRKDYGFKAMWTIPDNSKENNMMLEEAYGINEKPTITMIIPNAPFDLAGLGVGESIISVNDKQWSKSSIDKSGLIKELNEALMAPSMRIGVWRNTPKETEVEFLVASDDICDVYVALVDDPGAYAYANGRGVYIESGLLEVLQDDDELAFIIAHEIAHVILKHVGSGREEDLANKSIRSSIEKEADEMSIRLMIGAAYDPAGAFTAIRKFDYENRGPITRFLGVYGAYMPTEQRIDFLKAYNEKVNKHE